MNDIQIVETHEVFHKNNPTGVTAPTYREGLEAGVQVMMKNPDWQVVEVRDAKGRVEGKVWRNNVEGRLIKSKLLG